MVSNFVRFCLWAVVICSAVMLAILGVMMFAKNILPEVHVPLWAAALSVVANFMFMAVIARFLWFQDQYFFMMNAFYPLLSRLEQVREMKKG